MEAQLNLTNHKVTAANYEAAYSTNLICLPMTKLTDVEETQCTNKMSVAVDPANVRVRRCSSLYKGKVFEQQPL